MQDNLKPSLAEFFGTFTLVFIGAGAGIQSAGGILGVAMAHGVALMVIVYTWGRISGAHVNPAVTFGLAITGKVRWDTAAFYWVAQFLGGIAAAFLLAWLIGAGGETKGSLTEADVLKTIVIEAVLTFFLVLTVYASGVAARNGNAAGLSIGYVLVMDILLGGALTGASMNPARTLGPALVARDVTYLLPYFVGPLAGGALAALLYDRMFMDGK
jgi:aquaporin Z